MSDRLRVVEPRIVDLNEPESCSGNLRSVPYGLKRELESDGSQTFSARFFQQYSRDAVLNAIYQPLARAVPNSTEQAVEAGLKAMTYPSYYERNRSRIPAVLGGYALAAQLQNARDLLKSVRHSDDFDRVRLRATLLDSRAVENKLRSDINHLKPSEISRLCRGHGIEVDELALWRAKGGNRKNKFVDLSAESEVVDLASLVGGVVKENYTQKTRLPGSWDVLIENRQLPAGLRRPGIIELKRKLPLKPSEEFGERWEFLARTEDRPRHVVYPTVSWSVAPPSKGQAESTAAVKLDFRQPRPAYNPLRHEVEHYNPLLGAVILSNLIEPQVIQNEFQARMRGKRYWSRPELDRSSPARMLELVHSSRIMEQIIGLDFFTEMRRMGEELDD